MSGYHNPPTTHSSKALAYSLCDNHYNHNNKYNFIECDLISLYNGGKQIHFVMKVLNFFSRSYRCIRLIRDYCDTVTEVF